MMASNVRRARRVMERRMSSPLDWKVPAALRPKPDDYSYDLEATLNSVLQISSIVPETAFSAQTLGTERAGNAVMIDRKSTRLNSSH